MLKNLPLAVLLASVPFASWALEPGAGILVKPILKSGTSWNGTTISYPAGAPEITGQVVEIQPGAETGWHEHPVPSFGLILEGTLEVSLKDGTKKILNAGDSVIEVVNTLHNGKNIGAVPVKLVVFYTGATGTPTTVKPEIKQVSSTNAK